MKRVLLVAPSTSQLLETDLPTLRHLRERGFELVLHATRDTASAKLEEAGFSVRSHRGLASLFWTLFRVRPDLVHVLGSGLATSFAVLLASRTRPVVLSMHRVRDELASAGRIAAWKRRFAWRLLARCSHVNLEFESQGDFDAFALIAPGARGWLIRGPAVDLQRFHPPREERIALDGAPLRILCGVRLRRDSGLEVLRQACFILRAKKIECEVFVAGVPDEKDPGSLTAAELQVWQREGWLRLVGRVEKMESLLRSADIAISPAGRVCLSRFLVEAAACGRALVAADLPGARELIEPEKSGLFFRAGDPPSLARALERLVKESELRAAIAVGARAGAEKLFNAEATSAKRKKLYDTLLSQA